MATEVAQAIIPELEKLLVQFFDPTTAQDAARKQQIGLESQLQALKNRSDCWNIAHKCIQLSQNPMVLWFAVSMIDHIFRKKWSQLQLQQRATIREFLFQFLRARHFHVPEYVANSLGNLIVRIAIQDWPHEDSQFLTKLLNTLKDQSTCKTGLLLIRQMADEFESKNIKLLPAEKDRAIINIKQHLPVILNTLRNFLEHQYTFVKEGEFTSDEAQERSSVALESLLQFLGWIPMNEVLNPELMDILFNYIHLHNDETSLIAFSCVNEILGQNYVPKEFNDFMVNIFNQLFKLLQALTQSTEGLNNFEEEYVDKFTQFTSLFVSHHLQRVEKNPQFPIIEFLSLLFRYSFMQTSLEGFLCCLEIWESFLDYIITQQEGDAPSSLHQRYENGLSSLGSELIRKIQFLSNGELLSSLGTESTSEEDDDSEFETYVSACLDVIGKIAQLYPNQILKVLSSLVNRAQELLQVHTLIENANTAAQKAALITIVQDSELLLRIFSQTACSFNSVDAGSGNPLLMLFVQMGNYVHSKNLYAVHPSFIRVEAQVFGTLRAFTPWIQHNVAASQEIVSTVVSILDLIILTLFADNIASVIDMASCVLLASLGKALPIIELPVMQKLLAAAPSVTRKLNPAVQKEFCGAVLCILLVPLGDSKSVNWDQRFEQTKQIIAIPILIPYLDLLRSPQFIESGKYTSPEVIKQVKSVTRLSYSLFQQVYPMEKRAKRIVFELTKDIIHASLPLFRTYLQNASVLKEILKFFLELFQSLRVEVGAEFARQTIGTFMEILKGDKIAELFATNNKNEIEVVEQFLALLNILMSFPGSTFHNYVSHILQLSVEIYPHVAEKDGFIGVKEAIFQVLYMIILTHLSSCQDQELQLAMKAFHFSFQRLSDLTIFKKNLHFLADLNKRIRLFSKEFFVTGWRNTFLQSFFNVLFDGMHRILEDDIIPIIYDLASIDFNSFFIQILPGLIAGLKTIHSPHKAEILNNFTRDSDVPTFTHNMQQMLATYRFITSCAH